MPPAEPQEPMRPAAPEETQRLSVGIPAEAQDTQKLRLPEEPHATQRLVKSGGTAPPIRLQRVDEPREADGQAQVPPPSLPVRRSLPWKVPVALAGLVLLGIAGFFALSSRPVVSLGRSSSPGEAPEAVPPAAEVYLEQARLGDAHAMRMLGVMYYYGLNVPQDREKGLQWYRKAAEKGSDAARAELEKLEAGH